MSRPLGRMAVAIAFAVATLATDVTLAQTPGGTLRITHRDNPPSASIHEEATISTVMPFMSVFNNLVMFDPKTKQNTPDVIIPDLATSWAWSADGKALTFKLRTGV
ncbi:MAG: peptide ABC transporter substrate-binding protein, partial [Alphaproteobacteria bacterium]|nr:peptide ABC transporter substrate-binding protein [Alphaproteobacteria bacterium]